MATRDFVTNALPPQCLTLIDLALDLGAPALSRSPSAALFDAVQRPINLNYIAMMPDGSLDTVADGRVVYRSRLSQADVEAIRIGPAHVGCGYSLDVSA